MIAFLLPVAVDGQVAHALNPKPFFSRRSSCLLPHESDHNASTLELPVDGDRWHPT